MIVRIIQKYRITSCDVIADIEYTRVKVNSEDLNKQSRDLRKRIQR